MPKSNENDQLSPIDPREEAYMCGFRDGYNRAKEDILDEIKQRVEILDIFENEEERAGLEMLGFYIESL